MQKSKSKTLFAKMIDFIRHHEEQPSPRSVVAKEFIQYEILYALDGEGLLRDLVFKGSASLRICRNSFRYSDSLEFFGGVEFNVTKLEKILLCLQRAITTRYGFHVGINHTSKIDVGSKYQICQANKFYIGIEISLDNENAPIGQVNFEITAAPTFTDEVIPIFENYPVLGKGRAPVLLRVETVDEILADKLVSYPFSSRVNGYDVLWDIAWLLRKGAKLDLQLIRKKLSFFNVSDTYPEFLSNSVGKLDEIMNSQEFVDQMRGSLPSHTFELTLAKPEFINYLVSENKRIFIDILQELSQGLIQKQMTEFKM